MIDYELNISPLAHTWLIDIDGTICKHNSHLSGTDEILPGVKEFWQKIPVKDIIILLSARGSDFKKETEEYLISNGLRFDYSIFGLPTGERILVNDKKDSGLITAISLNLVRDQGLNNINIEINPDL